MCLPGKMLSKSIWLDLDEKLYSSITLRLLHDAGNMISREGKWFLHKTAIAGK